MIKNGIETSSHSGTRLKFGQKFVKKRLIDKEVAAVYSELFEKRNKGDYNDFFDFDRETVERLLPRAKKFVDTINDFILNS